MARFWVPTVMIPVTVTRGKVARVSETDLLGTLKNLLVGAVYSGSGAADWANFFKNGSRFQLPAGSQRAGTANITKRRRT